MNAPTASHRNVLPVAGRIVLEDPAPGLLTIRLLADARVDEALVDDARVDDADDLVAQLHAALTAAATRADLRAVVLAGIDTVFGGGDRARVDALIARGTTAALAAFPLPTIAALPGDTLGAGLLLAAQCDVLVCAEEARYGWSADGIGAAFPTPAEHAFFETRFGPALAAELLTTARALTGLALREGHGSCAVVPADAVMAQALALAARLADKSAEALHLLKSHLARPQREGAAALAVAPADEAVVEAAAEVAVPKTLGKHIAVRDDGDGVLTLTLRRGGKKHDTWAMAQDLQAAFAHALFDAAADAGHRAIVLASEYAGFLPDSDPAVDDALLALMRTLSQAPLPVVAIAGAVPSARAWCALLCCDAVIHQDDGHYDASTLLASPTLAPRAARVFALRLGDAVARELLLSGAGHTGATLTACSPALRSVPRNAVAETALARARGWAAWPRAALAAWKAERARALDAALAVQADDADPAYAALAETPVASATPVALASTVVTATLHPSGIAEIAMHDRASKNMLSPALIDGLAEAFAWIARTPACKAVVLTGYDTYFCSGGTRDALRAIQEGKVAFTDDRTFRLPLDCPVPVIAAMQGHGIGAGLSLGLFCDFPMLSAESQYISPYMAYGFTPGVGATLIVPARFGRDLSCETLLTAGEYEGCALKARGVSLPVLPRESLRDAAMALALRLAHLPRSGLVRMKRQLDRPLRERLDAVCAQEVEMHAATFVGRADTLARIESTFGRGEDQSRAVANEATHATTPAPVAPEAVAAPSAVAAAPAPTPSAAAGNPAGSVSVHALRETLLGMLARELHLDDDELDPDRQYTDLGLDSITGVTWIRKVNDRYDLSLDATIVYTYPSVSKLAQHVKSLIDGRDAGQSTLDYAELEARKLRAFGQGEAAASTTVRTTAPAAPTAAPKVSLSTVTLSTITLAPIETVSVESTSVDSTARDAGPAVVSASPFVLSPLDTAAPVAAAAVAPVAPSTADGDVPLSAIRATLQAMLARELHLDEDEVDPDRQYTDLGLDSITGVTWIRKVNDRHDLSLDATIVYTYPSVSKLAQHVKSLIDARGAGQSTLDYAELEARKLRAFGQGEAAASTTVATRAPTVPAATAPALPVAPKPTTGLVPLDAPAQDVVPAVAPSMPVAGFRRLSSWRRMFAALPAAEAPAPAAWAPEDIAVIGMAGQFPMARDIDAFWRNLRDGVDGIRELTSARWDIDACFQAGEPAEGKTYSRWLGQLDDYDRFDPLFFSISPAEARAMDPQQRVFLEACWHGIEHAGYDPRSLAGSRCGVFVGAAGNDYGELSRKARLSAYGFTGNAASILAARIAYVLDLQGPCITIDTACSASLVAIANACDSLGTGASDLALAGGVYVGAGPTMHIMTAQSGMLSPDGRCYTFDHRANGFVPGEAVGVVVLKRLSDAERDGDHIHAVVRGWGINQDGRTNGITAPNPASQTRLMQEVYRRHRIAPSEIQLIEAHGTGTPLGDPIEIRGLVDAFGPAQGGEPHCALGSVKSNIGHCLTAAGATAFIKAVLALSHRALPPTIHFERLNPHIRLDGTPFYVNTELRPWAVRDGVRRHAAVSSFGYSGTNAHLVVGEYVAAPRRAPAQLPPAFIVPLSAKTAAQLNAQADALLRFLRERGDTVSLADVAYTLQVGRTAMEERLGFVVDSIGLLIERLQAHLDGRRDLPDMASGQVHKSRESLSLIEQDEEFKDALLERWIAQRKYPQLLKLWAKGLALDWRRLYDGGTPARIPLPTYPFARERYWIDTPDAVPALPAPTAAAPARIEPARVESAVVVDETPTHLFFEERWVDADEDNASAGTECLAGGVVLIGAEGAAGDAVIHLPQAIRIAAPSALVAAVDEAHARSGGPVAIVCTSAYGRGREGIHQVFELFARIKACAGRVDRVLLIGRHDPSTIDGVWDVSWIGFERSLRLAMPGVAVSLLFTDGRAASGPHIAGLLRKGGIVSYREGRRRTLALERVPAPARTSAPPLKQQGHYLITGGCGALGAHFARRLAETCQAHLTLVGRRPASETVARQLDVLRAAGAASAEYVALDLADAGAVAAWARTLSRPLSGVIHAAGVASMRPFEEKTAEEIDAVLGPKTAAMIALDAALRDQPLDMVCCFSSSSAILGDGGACDYAVANRFLGEYAAHREQAGLPGRTVIVEWPLWDARDADGAGMGPETPAQTAFYLRSSGQSALRVEDGLQLWQDLLAAPRSRTLVMHGLASRIVPFLDRLYAPSQETAVVASAVVAGAQATAVARVDGDVDPREPLRAELRSLIAGALELAPERLDDDTNLADYGFDSIGLTALAKQLQAALAVDVTPALFFNRPNVRALVEYFAAEYPGHFAARYRPVPAVAESGANANADAQTQVASVPAALPATASATPSWPVPVDARGAQASTIAIVGMSGRFPKAGDVEALWHLLAEGRSGIDEIPATRWNWRDYFVAPGDRGNRIQARSGGFIDGMDRFDPLFFEVSPAEAEEMDPAERLLMMEAYRAIEDAGIAPASLRGHNVGVFVGMEESQYSMVTEAPGVTTLGAAMISSRLSYFLDLRGPALATNTACSSGLVALHQAVGSLQQGECEAALAASVSLSLSPKPWMKMSEAGMLSPDGLCRAFSKQADGIGIGEAVVALVLVPLRTALERGLPVYGTIRGSGTNFDGKTNGVTAPNGQAQEQLIETVFTRHGIDVRDIGHVIAHGTGTRLGDPVELNALHNAFKALAARTGDDGKAALPCAVTSVKSNLGHTMAASGLVSLVALLQGIAHRQIPATLHCEEDNDYIAWRDSRLYVNKTTRSWDVPAERPRLGAVSAFGRSGTNAHVVIEEFRDTRRAAAPAHDGGAWIVPVSARTAEQLRQRAEDLVAFLRRSETDDLAALAMTLQDGRDPLPRRLAVVATSCAQLRRELEDWLAGAPSTRVITGSADWRRAVARTDAQTPAPTSRTREALDRAAEAWVRGEAIDWSACREDANAAPRRLHLPTYPFAQDRYWIADAGTAASTPASPSATPAATMTVATTATTTQTAAAPAAPRRVSSIEAILDQVETGQLAGCDAAAALKALAAKTK